MVFIQLLILHGMVDITDDVKELLKYTDLVLLDIKHIDSDKSKKLVGFGNEKELNFARFFFFFNIDMWIRQVIIPGITDDEDDLKKLRDFISSLKTVRKIEFLKYHSMGKFKWKNLNIPYDLENIREATSEDIERAKRICGLD